MNTRTRLFVAILAIATCFVPLSAYAQTGVLYVVNDFVGIGTDTPSTPLEISASGAPQNTVIQLSNDGPARFRVTNTLNGETWNIGHRSPAGTGLVYSDVGDAVSEMLLDVDGNLTIAGTLTTAGGTYPDFVFGDDYKLRSVPELASYIEEHGHLPNVATAQEVAAQGGINMSNLQLQLLEKVEELTLYVIDQHQSLDAIRKLTPPEVASQLSAARNEIDDLNERLGQKDQAIEELKRHEAELSNRLARLEAMLAADSR